MKNFFTILTFVAFALSFTACSSDGDSKKSGLTARINGVDRTFTNIEVTEEDYGEYSDYIIEAVQSDDATKTLTIKLGKESLGTDSIYYIQYLDGTTFYQVSNPQITSNVTESSASKIKATFSGILNDGGSGNVNIANGVIDLKP
jgi:hypothetical protein